MRMRYMLAIVVLLALGFGVGRLSAAGLSAAGGTLEPPGPPRSTYSYTPEDIYNRLDTGPASPSLNQSVYLPLNPFNNPLLY